MSGPDDDVRAIVRRLDRLVGRDGYEFLRGLDDSDDEDDDDWLPDADDSGDGREGADDWDEKAVDRAIETLRARRPDVRHIEHVLAQLKIDLSDGAPPPAQSALDEAVREIIDMLEQGEYLAWEAVIRAEQGLALLPAHRRALGRFCWFEDEDDDAVTIAITDDPRPSEPWYETVRALAPHLVVERFVTSAVHYDGEITRGADLLRAIEAHAGELSLPASCTTVREILPPALWHRLELQPIFDTLSGLGYRWHDGRVASLAEPEGKSRIDAFHTALHEHAESLAALGWGIDDLLAKIELPPDDRARLLEALDRRDRG